MSQVTPASSSGAGVGSSAPAPEENATSTAARTTKQRSCVVCRTRKVRCDKLSPCSNCRRANIACVVSPNDRPPKWARRLDRIANNAAASPPAAPQDPDLGVDHVMERLRNLEGLVKELSGQLEQANAAAASSASGSVGFDSPGSSTQEPDVDQQMGASSATSTNNLQKHFGRLVIRDANQSRYIGSGFWSRVSDEIEGLKTDTLGLANWDSDTSEEDESSPGKTASTQELERTPSERHAFLFGHNLSASAPSIREFRPLPSQIPFLLSTFSENVNFCIQIVHMPSVNKMVRELRGTDMSGLTPANEALMFSIYYAAVTSMEEDDVMTNFGSTKAELNIKYRLGLEHALAKADFFIVPDIVLVQAFAIFLFLVRRHDSPRFVWMMTGLVIRMAQAIGLQRDGSHFGHLTPFEVEIRRRVWWALCVLDIRASEDLGTEFTIAGGSFDTKLPVNLGNEDLFPEIKEVPAARQALTDTTFACVSYELASVIREMMAPWTKEDGTKLEEQSLLLNNLYKKLERGYLQYETDSGNIATWVGITATRLVISKMTLLIYLPALFSSPSGHFSDEIRIKLLVAAIEVAEYNHALNDEPACRHWRWIYQTYTHWHAVVYLLIEISRRPWSSIVERAWIALHSSWLIPAQSNMKNHPRIWVPLRKLMANARRYREVELKRLRGNASAVEQLEICERNNPVPASSGPFPNGNSEERFRDHWRSLVSAVEPVTQNNAIETSEMIGDSQHSIVLQSVDMPQEYFSSEPAYGQQDMRPNASVEPVYPASMSPGAGQSSPNAHEDPSSITAMRYQSGLPSGQADDLSFHLAPTVPVDWSGGQLIGQGFMPWLWADADPTVDVFADMNVNMDMEGDINWNSWIESATGME